jgi:hypothetical protein
MQAIAVLSFGLVANLVPLMTFAATLPRISTQWSLSAGEAGWIGGIYFAGYAAAVPIWRAPPTALMEDVSMSAALVGAFASFAFGADGVLTLLRNRVLMEYVVAFAGNTWECSPCACGSPATLCRYIPAARTANTPGV